MRAPGPKPIPFIGAKVRLGDDPLSSVVDLTRRYGGVVDLGGMGPRNAFLVTDPEALERVLVDNAKNYRKGRVAQRMRNVLGDGLLLLEGDAWRRRRRLLSPPFSRARVGELAPVIVGAAKEAAARWVAVGAPLDLREELLRLTMTITVRAFFRTDATTEIDALLEAWRVLFDDLTRERFTLVQLPRSVPTPGNVRSRRARETIDRVLLGFAEEKRRNEDDGSLLSALVRAKDESGNGLTQEELRDEIVTLFVGGYDTSSSALTFAFAMLSLHPEVARIHREEIRRALGNREATLNDLASMPYNRAVIEETLRLHPPSWVFTREAIADDVVAGFTIPRGSQLLVSPYAVHHDPRLWTNPEGFDPSRFVSSRPQDAREKQDARTRSRFTFIPFGGGARLCLGEAFAMMAMQLVLATVTSRVVFDVVPGKPVVPIAALGLKPRHPIFATVRAATLH